VKKELAVIKLMGTNNIQSKIFTIRSRQVMLGKDLAQLYGIETKVLSQAVKRNASRFPQDFMFQLTKSEFANWKSQFVTSNTEKMGIRKMPFAFTEQGVAMLSGVLSSKRAIEVNLKIMRTFVEMKKFLISNAQIFQRLDVIELKQLKTDEKLEKVFEVMSQNQGIPKQGIFFEGQMFDAHNFVSELIRKAKKSIVVIDNYVDDRVFKLLTKRRKGVKAVIYTKNINKALSIDLSKHNSQYAPIELKIIKTVHDRFIVLDNSEVYHFGASLKDLGFRVKMFCFLKT